VAQLSGDQGEVRRLAELLLPEAPLIAERGVRRMHELLPAYARVPESELMPVLLTNLRNLLGAISDPRADASAAQDHFRTSGTTRARQGITSDEMLNGWRIGLEVVREQAHRVADRVGIGKEPLLEFVVASLKWGDVGMRMSASAHHEAEIRELGRLVKREAALRRVATMVARGSAPARVFAQVAEEVGLLVAAETAMVFQYVSDREAIVVGTWGEVGGPLRAGRRLTHGGDSLIAAIHRTRQPARMEDDAPTTTFSSVAGSPVLVDGLLWGAILAASSTATLPADAEGQIAQFTDLVAAAISNVQARVDLAASRARLVAAADDERRRVVRDLHDGAQQRLVHTVVTLKLARRALEREDADPADLVDEALANAERTMDELRELAHGILPSVLTDGGLRAGVRALASRMPVPVRMDVAVDRLPLPVEATAYFTVAEALTNVVKHARADRATVHASLEDGQLHVEVTDDGIGGAQSDGTGLVGLRDRLAAVDGTLQVQSSSGAGTCITARIPVPSAS
jgi:signal transduction histidine kinase